MYTYALEHESTRRVYVTDGKKWFVCHTCRGLMSMDSSRPCEICGCYIHVYDGGAGCRHVVRATSTSWPIEMCADCHSHG